MASPMTMTRTIRITTAAITTERDGTPSKHLGPIVLSRHRVAHCVIDESVGPITAYEALALVSGGALAMGLLER
jgi:hypothetical protein